MDKIPLLDQVKAKLPAATDREGIERVATDAGVSPHTLRKIITGETADPRVGTLQALLDYYEGRAA